MEEIMEEIPEIKIENNEVVLKTIAVPLIFNGQRVEIVLKEIPSGKRKEIIKKCLKTGFVGQQMQSDLDAGAYQTALVFAAIKSAPFEISEKMIESLPISVVDYLYMKYNEFADSSKKKD